MSEIDAEKREHVKTDVMSRMRLLEESLSRPTRGGDLNRIFNKRLRGTGWRSLQPVFEELVSDGLIYMMFNKRGGIVVMSRVWAAKQLANLGHGPEQLVAALERDNK